MRRGEIRMVDLDPVLGSDADQVRPAVIVVYPFQVLLPAAQSGLPQDSKAQAEQVRSVATVRIGRRVGVHPADLLAQLDAALRLHLDL